ncbi:MAG: adenylate kinase [Chloroflexota bacterium]
MNIVLLGPPGVGKGTQAKRLRTALSLPHIATGDVFRTMSTEDSDLGREVLQYLNRGEYVPDPLTIQIVLKRIHEPDAGKGFLLDGFPRTEAQAQALDDDMRKNGSKIDVALYITAPQEVLVRRLSGRIICPQCHAIYNSATNPPRRDMVCDVCGHELERRTDETPEVVRTRLETYAHETEPLVAYYRRAGNLAEVDGSRSMDAVEHEVDKAVGLQVR